MNNTFLFECHNLVHSPLSVFGGGKSSILIELRVLIHTEAIVSALLYTMWAMNIETNRCCFCLCRISDEFAIHLTCPKKWLECFFSHCAVSTFFLLSLSLYHSASLLSLWLLFSHHCRCWCCYNDSFSCCIFHSIHFIYLFDRNAFVPSGWWESWFFF